MIFSSDMSDGPAYFNRSGLVLCGTNLIDLNTCTVHVSPIQTEMQLEKGRILVTVGPTNKVFLQAGHDLRTSKKLICLVKIG